MWLFDPILISSGTHLRYDSHIFRCESDVRRQCMDAERFRETECDTRMRFTWQVEVFKTRQLVRKLLVTGHTMPLVYYHTPTHDIFRSLEVHILANKVMEETSL